MPTVYEHVRYGQVDDRVEPTPGDYEDTRIGLAVLEALEAAKRGEVLSEYWRVEGQDPFKGTPAEPGYEPPIPSPAEPATEPDIDVPAQPANPEE